MKIYPLEFENKDELNISVENWIELLNNPQIFDQNSLKVIQKLFNKNYRVLVIQDIKLHYANIMAHLKVVVMEINVNLLMVIMN